MRDADWLDEPDRDHPDRDRRSRPLLMVLAGLPWLVVIGLLVMSGRSAPGDDGTPAAPVEHAITDSSAAATPNDGVRAGSSGNDARRPHAPVASPLDGPVTPDGALRDQGSSGQLDVGGELDLEVSELRGRWRVEPGAEEAVALAVVAGRAWLTGVDPVLTAGGLTPRDQDGYAEHLVVEALEQPAGDAVVVTLLAVVLDTRSSAMAPSVHRIAVPVAMTPEGPRLAGRPWELPPPVLEPVALAREPLDDPAEHDAARRALEAAGLTDQELLSLHRTSGWPVIAEVGTRPAANPATGVSPAPEASRQIWLRRHLGGFVVAGTTLAGAGAAGIHPDAAHADADTVVDAGAADRDAGGRP